MPRRITRAAVAMSALSVIVLVVGFIIADMSGSGYLPFLPQSVILFTMVAFCLICLLANTTVAAEAADFDRQKLTLLPKAKDGDVLSRVVRHSITGEEVIVHGHPNSTIQEILKNKWPFEMKQSKNWYLVDEDGNDVTSWPISNWDGVAVIYFRDILDDETTF